MVKFCLTDIQLYCYFKENLYNPFLCFVMFLWKTLAFKLIFTKKSTNSAN